MDNHRNFDLEERTFKFAKKTREFVNKLLKTTVNFEDGKQLVRSTGSVGANYIEANEALSKKDFLMKLKICRKEAKESRFWLNLIEVGDSKDLVCEQKNLIQESQEIMNIFGAIIRKIE